MSDPGHHELAMYQPKIPPIPSSLRLGNVIDVKGDSRIDFASDTMSGGLAWTQPRARY